MKLTAPKCNDVDTKPPHLRKAHFENKADEKLVLVL